MAVVQAALALLHFQRKDTQETVKGKDARSTAATLTLIPKPRYRYAPSMHEHPLQCDLPQKQCALGDACYDFTCV